MHTKRVYFLRSILSLGEWFTFSTLLGLERTTIGDPLSPFLFTIVVEALGGLLSKAKDLVLIGGIEASGGEISSHAFNLQMIQYYFLLQDGMKL